MPRKKIKIEQQLDYLSVLDESGALDAKLEPDIPEDILLKLYRTMVLARKFDERLLNLQRQGRIGTFPPSSGQEAAHLGAVAALESSDWFVPAFRETAAEIWRGRSLESFLLYNNGFSEGVEIAPDSNNLPMAVPVASQILHAVGLAWAARYRKTDRAVLVFMGDGATSEGDFHEGLNFAAVFQSPAIFVCQNNQWAISMPRSKQTLSETIAQKALAYGMPGLQIDGNDILASYAAVQEALQRARSGDGPSLIECVTYRMTMHTTADDPRRYRTEQEVELWKARDPITRFQKYLFQKGFLTDERSADIERTVLDEIQSAVDSAEERAKSLGDPADIFLYHYDELPPYLQEQREELVREIEAKAKEAHNG